MLSGLQDTAKQTGPPVGWLLKERRRVGRGSAKIFEICVVEEWHGGAKAEKEVSEKHRVVHTRRERRWLTIIEGRGTMNASKLVAK